LLFFTVAILFTTLIVLSAFMVITIRNSGLFTEHVPIDLEQITAEQAIEYDDLSNYFLPEFVGITSMGERLGISTDQNIISDIFSALSPSLSELLLKTPSQSDDEYWNSLIDSEESVYIRFHQALPDFVIGLFADINAGQMHSRANVRSYVYELFFIPYTENRTEISVAVRSLDGKVFIYHSASPEKIFTTDDIKKFVDTYRSGLTRFNFSNGEYQTLSKSEPIFVDQVLTKKILVTPGTASMLFDQSDNIDTIMRIFSLNPDKLISTSVDERGFGHYIDSRGILYIRESDFEYQSTADDGMHVNDIIGYTSSIELREYIRAAISLISDINHINRLFTGVDADMLLYSVASDNGKVTLTFKYFFDNIRITDIENAFTVTFENGVLRHAKLYTVAVRNLVTRVRSYYEWWFYDQLAANSIIPQNMALVYRGNSDSNSISAEWSAILPPQTDESRK